MAKGRDDSGYTGGISGSDPFMSSDTGDFGYGKKLHSPGSGMTQARNDAAERALSAETPPNEDLQPLAEPPAAKPSAPVASYSADGDPYEYGTHPDGSVTVRDPSGGEVKLTTGPAYQAIMGQIAAGQLKPKAGPDEVTAMSPEKKRSLGFEDPRVELPRLDAASAAARK